MKKKNLGFTLAEVLIVIGIIGVVAALTLPNLNHATGDKETVTRLQKAYSILNEANDRAVAIYGSLSEWDTDTCRNENDFVSCYMSRIGEFLKISEIVDLTFTLPDGMVLDGRYLSRDVSCDGVVGDYNDVCLDYFFLDINGKNKGKNEKGKDIFAFWVRKSDGFVPINDGINTCIEEKDEFCTFWVLEYGNLDYLKADENGKCNDSNIILDGTTNISCH